MKKLSLLSILICVLLAICSCEKADIADDDNGQTTSKTGKAYKVTVMTRSASATDISSPITVYAIDSNGDVVAQQTIYPELDNVTFQLTSGSYTLTAISGSTDFSDGYSTTPLLIGHSDITVTDASTSVNILLSYAVASLNVTVSSIPTDATALKLTISNQYASVSNYGEYSGSTKCTIPLIKQSQGSWTTGTVYLLPGCGTNTVMSLALDFPNTTTAYSITYSTPLKASVPYTFTGIYSGSESAGVKVTGTLTYGEWESKVQGTFSFGPTGTNTFSDITTAEEYTVSSLPAQGSVWNNHVVAYTDGNEALLISLKEWDNMTSAYYEADPDVAKDIAASYTEGDITSWSIPTADQARLIRSLWKGDNIETINSAITQAGGTSLSLTDNDKNVRYLCEAATYTFSFAESGSVTAAGKTVKTYRLRLVKPVTFKVTATR